MTLEELKNEMKLTSVFFKYKKKDGTIREAVGTTNLTLINMLFGEEFVPKGESTRKISEENTRYFDLDKKGWRSFKNDSFIVEDTIV